MMRILGGILIVVIGISILTGLSFVQFLIAIMLIVIGIRILGGHSEKGKSFHTVSSGEDRLNEVAIFSPLYKSLDSKRFAGGKVVMIFSGGEIDLWNVKTEEKEITLDFVVVFGGGKLVVPKDWKVNVQGTAIFGGYQNRIEEKGGEVTLNLHGAVIFGGIEIVN